MTLLHLNFHAYDVCDASSCDDAFSFLFSLILLLLIISLRRLHLLCFLLTKGQSLHDFVITKLGIPDCFQTIKGLMQEYLYISFL